MTDLASRPSEELIVETPAVADPADIDWLGHGAYDIIGNESNHLPLEQVGDKQFRLRDGVSLRYKKATGLEKYVANGKLSREKHARIRNLHAHELGEVDLASVPGPMRWFANSYGAYTPAALFHDWLIPNEGEEPFIPEVYADRYFRYQLGAVDIPRLKRYVMWAATAVRTRWMSKKPLKQASLIVWAVLALAGIATFIMSALDLAFGTGMVFGSAEPMLVLSIFAPVGLSFLWGRQYGAGIVAAIAALWLLPPAVLAAAGYLVYLGLERLGTAAFGDAAIATAREACDAVRGK